MARDPFQIALEHHRAGRLTQAEAGYKAILADEVGSPDAAHWLGVLFYQAGQLPQAIVLLEQAAAIRPADPAFQHNLGQAYARAGRKDDAVKAFTRAVEADPSAGQALVTLASARLARGVSGDAQAAVTLLKKAHAGGLDTADLHHHLGVALLAAGRHRDAIAACQTALAKKPGDATIYFHLALAQRGAGELKETRKCLIKALEVEPSLGQAWCALAMLDAEAGKWTEAAGLFRRAIAADHNYVAAYHGLARALRAGGKHQEALAAEQQAQRLVRPQPVPAADGSVAELEKHLTPSTEQAQFHYAMAVMMNVFPPAQVPGESVAGLFDKYADSFDQHLRQGLEYRMPELVAEAVTAAWAGKPMDILDLGCGTGLCGPLLRPMASTLAGVDLSPAMIDKARERGAYDRLEVGDLVETMRKSPRAFDLLVAADVLLYLGDLSLAFEAAAEALRPCGLFAFSVEAGTGDRYELVMKTRRYTHSKPYIQHLAKIHGFEEVSIANVVARKEAEKPVEGMLVVLRLPGGT